MFGSLALGIAVGVQQYNLALIGTAFLCAIALALYASNFGALYKSEFILRFTISHPHMDTTIVGTVNPEHLNDNVDAVLHGVLPADVYEEAKRRLTNAGLQPIAIEAQ